jgi:hypothetical protein
VAASVVTDITAAMLDEGQHAPPEQGRGRQRRLRARGRRVVAVQRAHIPLRDDRLRLRNVTDKERRSRASSVVFEDPAAGCSSSSSPHAHLGPARAATFLRALLLSRLLPRLGLGSPATPSYRYLAESFASIPTRNAEGHDERVGFERCEYSTDGKGVVGAHLGFRL